MQPQDDHTLWDLLGKAPQPQVSGKFTDDVLRRIRLSTSDTASSWQSWWKKSWRTLGGLTTGLALLAFLFTWQNSLAPSPNDVLLAKAPVDDPVAFKDLDLVLNDNELWLGTVSY